MMREPSVEDFFTRLIMRVAPKSYAQANAEVVVTRRFLENFSGEYCTCQLAHHYYYYYYYYLLLLYTTSTAGCHGALSPSSSKYYCQFFPES